RVSGYALDALLPENDGHLARALVGTEGGCATVLEATVRLVRTPPYRALTVVGFPDVYAAAEAALAFREHRPLTVEGVDGALLDALHAARPTETASSMLPPGRAWLYLSAGGQSAAEALATADGFARTARTLGGSPVVLTSSAEQRALWRLREDGAGIATRTAQGTEAYPGWEDAAVPPERLAAYLRDLHKLQSEHGVRGAMYGHFADGCIHTRLDFDLLTRDGVRAFRSFMESAADLAAAHGGSLSGEHGDGQARSELLTRMYSPQAIEAFARFKDVWDPDGGMNPGAVVRPRRIDNDLRVFLGTPTLPLRTELAFAHDRGDFPSATRRCVGVAKCVSASGGVMCPSYRVTHDEQHSTRGRARLLFEMASGRLVTGHWRSTEVRDALDLCLSCKGCKRDCPVGVDMATYKSEFLAQHYRRRLRPASHYSMGALPRWLRLAGRAPRLVNAVSARRFPAAVLKRAGGIAPERDIPALAPENLRQWLVRRPPPVGEPRAGRVLLWPDTFTTYFDPQVGQAAVRVLERLGYAVEAPTRPVCCGLTWLTTGQVATARRVLRRSVAVVRPWLAAGVPVIGLEPSCAAMLRCEVSQLLPGDADAEALSASVRTFAEILAGHAGELGTVAGPGEVLVQPHCHQYADLGTEADRGVLEAVGLDPTVIEGCCGLAGNFGFEAGHYDVSMAVAEHALLPAIRAAPRAQVLADGFSCRTQIR
ncbi:MAG: 4Fe-4S dicluster domain-containing protein, partial [Actinomycetota bacterium]|nr:4Fe-4S dicluster domain-containing protein [Actinomycetota bacterium]